MFWTSQCRFLYETQISLNLSWWKQRTNEVTVKIPKKTASYEATDSAKATTHAFEQTAYTSGCECSMVLMKDFRQLEHAKIASF